MSYVKWVSVLLRDWREKRRFEAKWPCQCTECGDPIDEGDSFFFFGTSDKLCESCYDEVTQGLEAYGS